MMFGMLIRSDHDRLARCGMLIVGTLMFGMLIGSEIVWLFVE